MTETGSFDMLPPKISLFSSTLSSGSSFGELYAWEEIINKMRKNVSVYLRSMTLRQEIIFFSFGREVGDDSFLFPLENS